MPDWSKINKYRVREPNIRIPPQYVTDDSFGFCGMFRVPVAGKTLRCIVSDGEDWQHVSVSIEYEKKPPTWAMMCEIKDLFWNDEDWVVQFHPAKSGYVNHHPGCLHLWKYTGKEFSMPTPPSIFVGPK